MTTYLVLTVIGDDKPGLVGSLANVIAGHGGNWLESSMSQLAGKFAGILRVSVEDEQVDGLIIALNGLSGQLKIVIERVEGLAGDYESGDARPAGNNEGAAAEDLQTLALNLVGNDRPGIVREISQALASLSVNVEQLNTECSPAPMSGEALFRARVTVQVPADVGFEGLQAELEKLADDLIVELQSE